jgi:hypothetical protein
MEQLVATGELIRRTGDFMKRMENGQVSPRSNEDDSDTSGVSDRFSTVILKPVVGRVVGCLFGIILGFHVSRQTHRCVIDIKNYKTWNNRMVTK